MLAELTPLAALRPFASCALSQAEAKRILWVLGEYQTMLESSIDAMIVPGTNKACSKDDEMELQRERLRWRAAQNAATLIEKRIIGKPVQS